ncbi:MAG: CD225/dispanin family protein [Marinifilaceae bacterium]|nr:CD225/dispanin family protein [Marinifilaceae bacterium]
MADYFYLNAQNEQKGPIAAEDLIKNGVTKNTLVWKDGMSQWQPAGNVEELMEFFQPKQSQTPPPPVPPVNAPQPPKPEIMETKPDNLLVWSILTTVLCCLPLGVVAIVYSSKVDNLWNSGQHEEAYNAAKNAKTFCLISLGTGVLFYILSIALGFMSAFMGAMSMY